MSVIPFREAASPAAFDFDIKTSDEGISSQRDEELARRLADGEPLALEALLRRHWEPLIRYAQRLVEDGEAAEDVVQNAFVRVWHARADAKSGSLRAYLYRVTRNLAIDEIRRRRSRSKRETVHGKLDRSAPQTPADVLESEQLSTAVNKAIQSLPQRRREAFTLVHLRGLSYGEVSEIMGISPKTLGNHISAALSDLRQTLRPLLPEVD